MEWIKIQEVRPNGCPCGYTEYISEDGTQWANKCGMIVMKKFLKLKNNA